MREKEFCVTRSAIDITWEKNLQDQLVLRVIIRFLIPFILLYALYVQLHGEYSPGGGFQAGVIFAAAFILYCLIYGLPKTQAVLSLDALRILSALGVLLYAGVGVVSVFMGGNFLDYDVLAHDPVEGQKLGILLVELGVGITVFSVMLMVFYLFVARRQ